MLRLERVKVGGSLARNPRSGAPTCLVSGHFPVASPCQPGKLQNSSFFCHVDNCENCGAGISSVVMAASLFRPVPGSIPGSNTELDRRSVNPSLQSGNGEPGSE